MIFNVLVFLMIVLITLYLANQGLVSSLIALATSIFSSILAMALTEPLQGIVGSVRPESARGVTFLLLFLFLFSGTRIAADMAVTKNIKLNIWVNRGLSGFLGFFTALTVVGSIVIGIEMLPVPRTLLGFDRFPGPAFMQSVETDPEGKQIKVASGEATHQRANVWFAPDRFVLALWDGASGRSLGGSRPWASIHPDLSVESYGYRTPVFSGSLRSAPADLVKVLGGWSSSDSKEYGTRNIPPQTGKNTRVVLLSVEITKGDKPPHVTSDTDPYFRISATQLRLVTDKNHQYYPIGSMFGGSTFEPMYLDSGFVVDEYVGKASNTIVQDWVFAIPDDEKPAVFEMKEHARNDHLADLMQDKPFAAGPAAVYPQRPYYKDLCTLSVTFDPKGGKVLAGRVYVLKPDATLRDVRSLLNTTYEVLLSTYQDMNSKSGSWASPAPAIPAQNKFRNAQSIGVSLKTDPDTNPVNWGQTLPIFLLGQATPDPRQFLSNASRFMSDDVVKSWNSVRSGSIIAGQGEIDLSSMKAVISRITPSRHPVVITFETETGYYVWVTEPDFAGSAAQPAEAAKKNIGFFAVADPEGGGSTEPPIFSIDLKAVTPP